MTSEIFADYEKDFARLRQEIDDRLRGASEVSGEPSKLASEAEKRVKGAEQVLKQLEMEARAVSQETRSALEPRIRQYRAELLERKKATETAKQEAARLSLLGADAGDPLSLSGKSIRDRERLLDANEGLNNSSRQLEQATRESLETERIGIDVMSDLRQQRDVILNVNGNVREIGANYGEAKRMLEVMIRRATMNRLLVRGVVAFMAFILLVSAYFIFGGSVSGSSPTQSAEGIPVAGDAAETAPDPGSSMGPDVVQDGAGVASEDSQPPATPEYPEKTVEEGPAILDPQAVTVVAMTTKMPERIAPGGTGAFLSPSRTGESSGVASEASNAAAGGL
eukprot:TRINITY_DN38596_c0_g1_i1.p1 TRINITY_DN38596_c0_g1~~TRINITY_DN38596_c0_g1_i1.p1  ORF type:complete len:338 (+),score=82.36 TRINITY_DN38596_c0_g1_i1:136-1149(+)